MIIGSGYSMLGDVPAAEAAFRQTFEDGVAGRNLYAAIYGPINLILIGMIKGQLAESLRMCEANIERFDQLVAGQSFPPIGALYILKGCLLLEEDRLPEAEQELSQGLSLVHWTGEARTHVKGYCAQARLHAIQGSSAAMEKSLTSLAEIRPEAALFAQALRHRFAARDWDKDRAGLDEARRWAARPEIRFDALPDITGVDPISEILFRTHLSAAHVLTRLAARDRQTYPLRDAHNYLTRQESFAESRGLVGWLVELQLVRALMYQVEGKTEEARRMLEAALAASAERGFRRIFLDESDLLRPPLEAVEPRLRETHLAAFAESLLEAMPAESAGSRTGPVAADRLSDRELDVLRLLAAGQSYKEIGQQLFLSLNTVQFHVKSIYSKLQVNKRVQAIEKARELRLL
jgi:LuxR family maltose regulon positive regulatory protein